MTLSDLLADLYRRFNYASSPASEVTTRLTALLNETQQDILSEPGMDTLLYDTMTFASVASTPEYSVLPTSLARIRTIYDTTNFWVLPPRSLAWYRSAYPNPLLITGIPDSYVDLGQWAVLTQPSNASELFVISTSATDGAAVTAYLEGYRTGGLFTSVSKAMNGTTSVSFGAAITDWVEITKFYVSAAAVGTITLREDSGIGTALSTIPISQTYARYRRIALAPTPASALTYTVDYARDVANLVNANDEPVLPPKFHALLAVGARMREYEKKDDPRYAEVATEYRRRLGQLKYYVYAPAGFSPVMGRRQTQRPSQLGGYYPSGS